VTNIQANRTSSYTAPSNQKHSNTRPIFILSDSELSNLEHRYKIRGVTKGGIFTLSEVRAERFRRAANGLGGAEICQLILDLAEVNADGFTTYLDLYHAVFPSRTWCGHTSIGAIKRVLHEAIIYCVDNSLPIVTALVVRSDTRQLSPEALLNIYHCAGEMGLSVGTDPENFVTEQILKAFDLFSTVRTLH